MVLFKWHVFLEDKFMIENKPKILNREGIMKNETRKVAFGCGFGAMVFCLVALAVVPRLWWAGLIAGSIAGYLAYDFREFFSAITKAVKTAWEMSKEVIGIEAGIILKGVKRPRPVTYLAILIGMIGFAIISNDVGLFRRSMAPLSSMVVVALAMTIPAFGIGFIAEIVLITLINIGMSDMGGGERSALQNRGYSKTYKALGIGVGKMVLFFLWTGWRYLFRGIAYLAKSSVVPMIMIILYMIHFVIIIVPETFRLIHCNKRLLCGIDGTIGGAISYFWLFSPQMSLSEKVMLVLFGMVLGMFCGVLHWELVSKRWLKVANCQ